MPLANCSGIHGALLGRLTEKLLQLHDARIGPDAVNRLRLFGIYTLLEHFAIRSIGIVLVRHDAQEVIR